ncbi:M36 family metallopeptidase [Saprospiraceae bacterium]|nr:M36 family metallopeptidase [Saprospiraceae bacterium]MDB4824425.1 M36 family metallopeptidase [Saprospiraceae bacterium]MDB9914952.1 M36 family metallopeptidase [Saprospiraceae bacterium]
MKIFTSLLFSIFLSAGTMAQSQISSKAVQHLSDSYEQIGLEASDIENVIVDHAYTDDKGISFIYLVQTHEGVPVYNAIMTIAISKKGKVMTTANRFIHDLKSKVASTDTNVSAVEAIQNVAKHFNIETTVSALRTDNKTGVSYFSANELAISEIPVSFKYEADAEGKLHKAYDLSIDMKENADYWSVRVDAQTGNILSKNNWTVYCNHDHNKMSISDHSCKTDFIQHTNARHNSAVLGDGASYRVYPFPAESPLQSDPVLLVDPSDAEASPLGWHDTDGMDGAEYTITRGNNVHAYIDSLSNNNSVGGEPEGGENLVFDFTHDQSNEPNKNTEAAQVNLFYANNFLHDFTYNLGFNEVAGNFQANNYSGEGNDSDYVRAEAIDGSGVNNANFSTPPDGGSGRMQMYLWDNPGGASFASINSPAELAGTVATVGEANYGQPIAEGAAPISGKAVLYSDGTQFGSQACNAATNSSELAGNIAIIDRGSCEFGRKSLNAEEAGAIAVVICNIFGVSGGDGEEVITLGGGADGGLVNIPTLMFQLSVCNSIKASISAGIDVDLSFVYTGFDEPNELDGSYENGIIAHEFSHGISNRLTGGANAAGCLQTFDTDADGMVDSGEQMGEGWSDFIGMIATIKEGDSGADAKPIGAYVRGESGIRRYPYSTDMEICPLTYNDIRVGGPAVDADDSFAPHPIGELIAAIGWDLTWALIDQYGLDPTWQDQTSGNYIAARLVIDGMKLQPCQPGYVDARDAILFADELNNDGVNVCTIWEVFARRGLGMMADQGSSLDHRDGTEDFTAMETCIEKLKVKREIAELVQPGAILTVDVEAINHIPGDAIATLITEKLQEGLSYIDGSAPFPATVNGNIVTFDIGMLEYNQPIEFSYKVAASVDVRSVSFNLEDLEDGGANFEFFDLDNGFNFFFETEGRNGTRALGGAAPDTEVDFGIITPAYDIPTDIEVPALRFWHKYDLEASSDAVFLSISTDGGDTWEYVTDFLKNGYNDDIQYGTFAIPALRAFSGSTNGEFIDSYVDLSAYKGESIKIRFRLGTDDNTTVDADFPGWIIDDIELMDLTQYEVETCIGTLADLEIECNDSTTIIVDTNLATSTKDAESDIYDMTLYPNPAKTKIYLDVSSPISEIVQIKLTSIEGRVIRTSAARLNNTVQTIGFNLVDLDRGMYLMQVQSENGLSTRKFVKN